MIKRILASAAVAALLGIGTAHAAYLPGPYSVASGGTGLASGTSGGVLYFNSTSTMASSGALTSNVLVKGGGSGAAPAPSSITDNGTTITSTEGLSVGALTASGTITLSGISGSTQCLQASSSGVITGTGSICATGTGTIPTIATATGASPITIAATNLLTTVVSMATPAAATINLPTAAQTAGFRLCIKDGTTNFATNNATLKSPTSGTIDGVAGSTGIVMNQTHQEDCVISDATNWWVE